MLIPKKLKTEARRISTISNEEERYTAVLSVLQERDRFKEEFEESKRIGSSDGSKENAELRMKLKQANRLLDEQETTISRLKEALEKTAEGAALLNDMIFGPPSEKLNNRNQQAPLDPIDEDADLPDEETHDDANQGSGVPNGSGASGSSSRRRADVNSTGKSCPEKPRRNTRPAGKTASLIAKMEMHFPKGLVEDYRAQLTAWLDENPDIVQLQVSETGQRRWIEQVPPVMRVISGTYLKILGVKKNGKAVFLELTPKMSRKKSLYGASVVATWAYNKYSLGQPCYLQAAEMKRHGFDISRGVISSAIISVSNQLLKPVVAAMLEHVKHRNYTQSDESPFLLLRARVKDKEGFEPKLKYLWLTMTGELDDSGPMIYVFNYAPTRAKSFIQEIYKDFHGKLNSDAYAAYLSLAELSDLEIILCLCWSHYSRNHVIRENWAESLCSRDSAIIPSNNFTSKSRGWSFPVWLISMAPRTRTIFYSTR